MDAFPELDIYFPESDESSLVAEMQNRSGGLWTWKPDSPVGRPVEDGQYFFHRDGELPCTLCLARKEPGHLWVPSVTPDACGVELDVTSIINEFDNQIAAPAAEAVEGMTSVGTDKWTLEDKFSSQSIGLLEHFWKSSNQGDLGNHPSDQRKWIAFLLHVFRNETDRVSGDVFGELLITKGWWPDHDVQRLVGEYDFAIRLLEQAYSRR